MSEVVDPKEQLLVARKAEQKRKMQAEISAFMAPDVSDTLA